MAIILLGATFAFNASALTTTTFSQTVPGDGLNFNNAGNWSNGLPDVNKTAIVTNLLAVVTASIEVGGLQLSTNATIGINTANATLTCDSGSITNSTITGSGILILNGALTSDGTSVLSCQNQTLNGSISVNSGVLAANQPITAATGSSITGAGGVGGGVFQVTSSGSLILNGTSVIAGNINVGSGLIGCALTVNNAQTLIGSLTLDFGSTINGTGSLTITGTLNAKGTTTVSIPITVSNAVSFANGSVGPGFITVISSKPLIFNGSLTMIKSTRIDLGTSCSLTCNGAVALTDISQIGGTGDFIVTSTSTLTSTNASNLSNPVLAALNNQGTINVTSGILSSQNSGAISTGSINGSGGVFIVEGVGSSLTVNTTAAFSGAIGVGTSGSLIVNKALSYTGSLTLDSAVSNATDTLGGNGSLTVTGPVNILATASVTIPTLTVAAGSTMTFTGGMSTQGFLLLGSNANVICNSALMMTINTSMLLGSNSTFTCNSTASLNKISGITGSGGTFAVSASGSLTSTNLGGTNVISAPFTNAGAVSSTSGVLEIDSYFQSAGGSLNLAGGDVQNSSALTINGGSLTGGGTITGSVTSKASVSPGTALVAGTIAITGAYTQTATGTLNVKLGGTGAGAFDQVTVGGTATFAGTIAVTTINAFTPQIADTFKAVTFGSRSGTFGTISAGATGLSPVYNAADVTLANVPPNPAPTLASIAPTSVLSGGSSFTLTATGTNFVATSVIQIGGSARVTTFVSATSLTATILAADIASVGTANITVMSPAPGGGTSGAVVLTISSGNPVPSLASISPSVVTGGSPSFTLTATGTNFTANSVIQIGGSGRTTTFVSATSLTATILATDIASAGSPNITVMTPTPGGGTSSAVALTVNPGGMGTGGGTLKFASSPSSSANPSNVGQIVTFTASATDSNNGTPGYAWDFGDGITAFGASVTHTYAVAELYTVVVKANNGSSTISFSFIQAVNDPGATAGSLTLKKAAITFNFKTAASDILVFTGTIPLPANFNPNGKIVVVNVGDLAQKTFTLSNKGAATGDKNNSFKLAGRLKNGVFTTPLAAYSLTLKKQNLFTGLTDFGFDNADVSKKDLVVVTVPIGISMDGNAFVDQIDFNYTASLGKSGKAKTP